MARLVTMRVLADQPRDVHLFATGCAAISGEQLVELVCKLRTPTHQRDESADIVRSEERVLPRVRFSKRERDLARIEWLDPIAITAWSHKTCHTIEDVLVRLGAGAVAFIVRHLAEH